MQREWKFDVVFKREPHINIYVSDNLKLVLKPTKSSKFKHHPTIWNLMKPDTEYNDREVPNINNRRFLVLIGPRDPVVTAAVCWMLRVCPLLLRHFSDILIFLEDS